MPPDFEEQEIDGVKLRRKFGGQWEIIPAEKLSIPIDSKNSPDPTTAEDKTELVAKARNVINTSTKVQHAIRDAKSNAYFPPLAVVDAVKSVINGTDPSTRTAGINVGTGELRNVLTSVGAGLGSKTPLSPLGYLTGGAIGSGIGQEFEAAAPDLFQSGYGSIDGPERTVPSLSNAVRDVAINTAGDLTIGALKTAAPFITPQRLGKYFTNSPTGFKAWDDLVERIAINKYNPSRTSFFLDKPKVAIEPSIDQETKDAINANPQIKMTSANVLGEGNPLARLQRFLLGEGEESIQRGQNRQIGEDLINFRNEIAPQTAQLTPAVDVTSPSAIGARGAVRSQLYKEMLSNQESKLYNDLEKQGMPAVVVTKPVIDPNTPMNKFRIANGAPPLATSPGKKEVVQGPIKLTGSNAAYQTHGAELDKMIAATPDQALAGDLRTLRERLNIGATTDLLPWDVVRNMETQIGRLSSNPNLPPQLKSELNNIRATLSNDVIRNLEGKIVATAKYWKKGAADLYKQAKDATIRKYDLFPDEIQSSLEKSVGEVASRPFERGGDPSKTFQDLMKSPADALRLVKTAGQAETRTAFMQQLMKRHQDAETGVVNGASLLRDLSDKNTSEIADKVLNAVDKQKLRYLAKVSARVNPKLTKLDQYAVQQGADDWQFNLPGEALAAVLGGGKTGLLKNIGRTATVHLGGERFANAYLNNDVFARRLVNAIGKPISRPGMGREVAEIIRSIPAQGLKLLIRSDGKEYEYDAETKEVTEKK